MSTPTALETTNAEKKFVNTYLELMQLSKNESLDKFNSTQDYNNLSSLGPSLPKCNYKFPEPQNVTEAAESTVTLKFKSIKPPFKFLTELSNIPVNFTIYKVKAQLIESLEILHNAGVTAKDLKLMIKSKVAQDAAALSSLVNTEEPISFNCMVSAPSGGKPAATTSKTDEDDPELEAVSDPVSTTATTSSISEAGWNKIYEIILQDIKDAGKAKELLAKLKQSV